MKFRTQLTIGHAVLLFVMIVSGAIAVVALRTTSSRLERVAREMATDMIAIERLRFQSEQVVATSRGYLLTGDVATMHHFSTAADRLEASLSQIDPIDDVGRTDAAARAYIAVAREAAARRGASGDPREVLPFVEDKLLPAQRELEAATGEFVRREYDSYRAAAQQARDSAGTSQWIVAIVTVFGVCFSLAFAWRSICKLTAHYKRAQAATAAARKATEARDELLAIVSHDLRNPLTTIVMGTNLLDETVAEPRVRKHVAAIRAAGKRMQHLIDELLDVAKLENGTFELKREPCAAAALLETTVSMFQARAIEAHVELESQVSDAPVVLADRERLLQVLSNLVGNALKFTPRDGKIVLAARVVDGVARFEVTDTGPGIAADHVPHVFERYWQGRSRGGSLGLGLYICKQLVAAHRGEIGVATELGAGSTFWFTAPRIADQ